MLNLKSINSSSLSRKKYGGGCLCAQGQNMLVGIELIELTKPCNTLNYEWFFKHCMLQTILHVFLLFLSVWNKTFALKSVKVVVNQRYVSYSRYDLLGNAV